MDKLWGKVSYNPRQGAWCVKGEWQGKRCYFSAYETLLGKRTCQSETEAIQLQLIISNEIAHGTFNPSRYRKSSKLHLKKYARQWLEEIQSEVSYGTWKGYSRAMEKYIIPCLGATFLPDIGHSDLKRLMRFMGGLSPKTKKNYMGALHRLMYDALKDGHISKLPHWIEFKGKNEVISPPIKYLTPEAQMAIIEAMEEKHRPIFLFMMATGCRPSEARALQKKDVFPDHILFSRAFGTKGELKEVKQKKAEPFPMTDEARAVLDMTPKSLGPWVFLNPSTGRYYGKNLSKIWNRACDTAKVQRFPLYPATRHSFACQLLNLGVDQGIVSRLLRHSDPRMIKRYATYEVASLVDKAGLVRRIPANGLQMEKKPSSK